MDLLDALGKGFSALEMDFKKENQNILLKEVVFVPQYLFRMKNKRELVLRTDAQEGTPLIPNKWLIHRAKAKSGYDSNSALLGVLVALICSNLFLMMIGPPFCPCVYENIKKKQEEKPENNSFE